MWGYVGDPASCSKHSRATGLDFCAQLACVLGRIVRSRQLLLQCEGASKQVVS